MAAAWGRAKRALATKLCIRVPAHQRALEDAASPPPGWEPCPSTPAVEEEGDPVTEEKARSSSVSMRRLSSSGSRSSCSKRVCAICLGSMRTGHGQALFTAECSHKFHFHCITSNVRHGNHICPICRAEWKELPSQGTQPADATHGRARVIPVNWPQDDGHMTVVRRLSHTYSLQDQFPFFRAPAEEIFNDDEHIDIQPETIGDYSAVTGSVEIKTYSEFQAIQQSVAQKVFSILIRLKAPKPLESANCRAPLDLVTVLDVSGSMRGAKLSLLKSAMRFVIQTLGPNDRLSVIAFSSTAWRLFPLRRMTCSGQLQAVQAVNALVDGGGTNIADGLKKGAKVIEQRRLKNPVSSIILLSDGQDTYSVPTFDGVRPNHSVLVPPSILPGTGNHVQIHTFGFGADHDSAAMHSIAETSSGTFSFIDAEGSIQNGFAQCIGGLLSVVVKEMRLAIECIDEGVLLTSIKSGSYASQVAENERSGSLDIGDLYADEERAFLITLHVPAAQGQQTVLIKPSCSYQAMDALTTTESIQVVHGEEVIVQRPAYCAVDCKMCPEVEREWHRVQATEDMSAARTAAETGEFSQAVSILEGRVRILESVAAQSSDGQCLALITELREMQERVESQRRYDESGRAYMLAGLSSHSWQRATARGDSTELSTQMHTYQTPSMVDMLQRSQALVPSVVAMLNRSPTVAPSRGSSQPSVRATKSFSERLP